MIPAKVQIVAVATDPNALLDPLNVAVHLRRPLITTVGEPSDEETQLPSCIGTCPVRRSNDEPLKTRASIDTVSQIFEDMNTSGLYGPCGHYFATALIPRAE